jgi:hypothetical protein
MSQWLSLGVCMRFILLFISKKANAGRRKACRGTEDRTFLPLAPTGLIIAHPSQREILNSETLPAPGILRNSDLSWSEFTVYICLLPYPVVPRVAVLTWSSPMKECNQEDKHHDHTCHLYDNRNSLHRTPPFLMRTPTHDMSKIASNGSISPPLLRAITPRKNIFLYHTHYCIKSQPQNFDIRKPGAHTVAPGEGYSELNVPLPALKLSCSPWTYFARYFRCWPPNLRVTDIYRFTAIRVIPRHSVPTSDGLGASEPFFKELLLLCLYRGLVHIDITIHGHYP